MLDPKDTRMLAGPTFGPGGMVKKRAKGTKKERKLAKKFAKLTKSTPTYGSVWSRDMDLSCNKENLQRIGKLAKDTSLPRAVRMDALVKLDTAAHICNGVDPIGKRTTPTKAAKKDAKQRRERLEWQAFNAPDLQSRIRAQNELFGSLGNA